MNPACVMSMNSPPVIIDAAFIGVATEDWVSCSLCMVRVALTKSYISRVVGCTISRKVVKSVRLVSSIMN